MNQNTFILDAWDYSYFAFLMVIGSLFHFVYKLLGEPFWAGLLFPTNESTFQHLKLLLLPSILFFTVQFFMAESSNQGFFLSRFIAVLIGMLAICIFFYTYTGIVGDNFIVMDILSFAFGVVVTMIFYRFFDDSAVLDFPLSNAIGIFAFYVSLAVFALFTVYPPQIALFFDPVTKSYDPLTFSMEK